jgi:hypothetical protein
MKTEEKLRALLAEARNLIAANRLVLGEHQGVREVQQIERRIDAVLAEPIEKHVQLSEDQISHECIKEDTAKTLARIEAWTHQYGSNLVPTTGFSDSYGDGMRAAKAQVSELLKVK